MRGQMIFHPVLKWLLFLRFVTATIALEECDQLSLSVPCTCGSQLEKRFEQSWSDHWQKVEGAPIEIFSSYLDERHWTQPNTVHLPDAAITVRTIAHGLQTEHAVNNIPPLFCYVHDGVEWMYVGRAEYVRVYRSSLHAEEYTTHFLLCFVPHPFRQVVTVGFGTAFCQITAAVDINHQAVLPSAGGELALSVCVSPLHSVVEPLQVAEFIEMYRLLGATHFTFYNYKTTSSLRELLNRYSKANLATIVPWYSLNSRQSYFYFDQRSALNDCLYRSAASATHVAVVDLDEFLVPRIDHDVRPTNPANSSDQANLSNPLDQANLSNPLDQAFS
uniref:Glycosyltransferase family 92 protein n=1 Tax=Plectus sambesii TaxID=2011161 RepID=A0A914W283_9BILA